MPALIHLWDRINLNRQVRKVTGSKVTIFYTILSLSYCFISILLLAASWQVNHSAGSTLEEIVKLTGNGTQQFSYIDGGKLRLCTQGLSNSQTEALCPVIWPLSPVVTQPQAQRQASVDSAQSPETIAPSSSESAAAGGISKRASKVAALRLETSTSLSDGVDGETRKTLVIDPFPELTVNGKSVAEAIRLEQACYEALKWPYHHLLMVRREDIISLAYQAWLLLMSSIAIFAESIPHIGSSFIVHIIALGWSIFQITTTQHFEKNYRSLILDAEKGACAGTDVISGYFQLREAYQIGTIVINFVSLVASGWLTWRLFKSYGWSTFKKTGASISISRAYKAALALSIGVQLSIFFYMSSVGLFIDEIRKGLMGAVPELRTLYLVGYAITTVGSLPWMYLAWYGIRRESKRLMWTFWFISVLYLACSGGMFKSKTFLQTFRLWPFVASIFSLSYVLIILTIALSIVCERNFGKGLLYYLERRNGETEETQYQDEFHPTPGASSDSASEKEKDIFHGDKDAVVINFANLPTLGYAQTSPSQLERGSSVGSVSTTHSKASSHALPTYSTLTTSISATAPSWQVGDDKHLMDAHKRADSGSSFGNKGSLGRDETVSTMRTIPSFSAGTGSGSSIALTTPEHVGHTTLAGHKGPKRAWSAGSGSSSQSKRIDLGQEL